jgi:PilZ domain
MGAQFAVGTRGQRASSGDEAAQRKAVMKIRYSERIPTKFPVIFAGDSFVGEGTVNNVSVPGCSIVSDRAVEQGTYLEMKVLLPDNAPSLCVELAKIRWRTGRRFGVEFIRMPGMDQVRLGRLIKRHRAVKSSARLVQPPVLHLP